MPTHLPLVDAGLHGLGLRIHVGPCLTGAGMGSNVAGAGTLMWERV